MPNVINTECHKIGLYAECHYAECRGALIDTRHNDILHNKNCDIQHNVMPSVINGQCLIIGLYAECHYTVCHYAECRGAIALYTKGCYATASFKGLGIFGLHSGALKFASVNELLRKA
jgi:hypothetical protein